MKKIYLIALTLLSMPSLADNHKGFYAGIGVSAVDDKQDMTLLSNGMMLGDTTAIRTGELIGGYKYNNALGAEIRIGSGLRSGEGKVYGLTTAEVSPTQTVPKGTLVTTDKLERDLGTYTSIYYKPELENDDAKLYALIGYTQMSTSKTTTKIIKDVAGKETDGAVTEGDSESYSGASYGIGIGFVVDEHININFEYKNICDGLYNKPNMASVNFDYRF